MSLFVRRCADRNCGVIVQSSVVPGERLACPRCREPLETLPPGVTLDLPAGGERVVQRCSDGGCRVVVQSSVVPGERLACPRCRKPLAAPPRSRHPAEPTPPEVTLDLQERTPSDPQPGTAPALPKRIGRFEIRRFLGEGGFGRVYEAHDPSLKRLVALKVPRPEQIQTADRVRRFLGEARLAAKLMHPHIVPVFDSGQDGPHHYIAIAYIPGEPLNREVQSHTKGMEVRRAVTIIRKLAEALAYAHREGVIHRDVKPGNVMLREDGEPLLMDFGLAARLEPGEERLTQGLVAMGTPGYMAPEQGQGKAVAASDQYSLGVTLFELLTGQLPFSAGSPAHYLALHEMQPPPSPRAHRPDLPRDLEAICLKCLEKEPAKRYAGCQELGEDLKRWLDGEPVRARLPGRAERVMRWARRKPAVAGLLASLLVLALATAVGAAVAVSRIVDSAEDARLSAKAADKAKDDAVAAQGKSEANARALRKQQAGQSAGNAWRLLDGGDPLGAMLWMADAVTNSIDDPRQLRLNRFRQECMMREYPLTHMWFDVRHAEFSPDSKRVVTTSDRGTARVWDAETGEAVTKPMKHEGPVLRAAFSPDGKRLITGSVDRTAGIWDAETGGLIHRLDHGAPVWFVAFSPWGGRVTTIDAEDHTRVWDAKTGAAVTERTKVGSIKAVSRTGRYVLTESEGEKVELWDVDKATVSATLGRKIRISRAAFVGDERTVALTGIGKSTDPDAKGDEPSSGMWVWDGTSDGPPMWLDGETDVMDLTSSGDGARLAVAGRSSVSLWARRAGMKGQPYVRAWEWRPTTATIFGMRLAFSGDGRRLVGLGTHAAMPQVDPIRKVPNGVESLKKPPKDTDDTTPVERIRKLPKDEARDGADTGPTPVPESKVKGSGGSRSPEPPAWWVESATTDKSDGRSGAVVWDAETGQQLTPRLPHSDGRNEAHTAFSLDGTRLLTLTGTLMGGELRVWKHARSSLPGSVPLRGSTGVDAWSSWFTDDGKFVVSGERGGRLAWEVLAGTPVPPHTAEPEREQSEATYTKMAMVTKTMNTSVLGPRGGIMVVTRQVTLARPVTETVKSYYTGRGLNRPATTPTPRELPGNHDIIESDPAGALLVTLEKGRSLLRVWDAKKAVPLTPSLRHRASVRNHSFSDDGQFFATCVTDGTFRVWDLRTGEPVTPPLRCPDIDRAIFSPDNSHLLTFWSPERKGGSRDEIEAGMSSAPRLHLWRLFPESETRADILELRCRAIGSREIDPTGNVAPLPLHEVRNVWETLLFRSHSSSGFPGEEAYLAWRQERAEECQAARLWPAAALYLDSLVVSRTADTSLRVRRGAVRAEMGQWDGARDDFDKALELGSTRPDVWLARAALDAQSGDAAYRRRCAALVDRFGDTKDADLALGLANVCALAPGALTDYSPLISLMRKLRRNDPRWRDADRGAVIAILHRSGRIEEAVAEGKDPGDPRGFDRTARFRESLYQAMAAANSKQDRLAADQFASGRNRLISV